MKKYIDYDPDLEAAVLGIFLLEAHTFGACYGIVSEECFHDLNHLKVFREIESYWKAGGQVDLLTISRRFYDKGITKIGDDNVHYYLAKLTEHVVKSSHIESWCLYLRELGAKRIMIETTTSGVKGEDDIFQSADKIQKRIQKALEIKSTNDWLNISEVTKQLIEKMDAARENGNSGLTTSFETLDKANGGFKPGNMIVLAARPGVGKSALMGKMAKKLVSEGKRIGIISLEMPASDVFARMIAAESNIPFWKIDRGLIIDKQVQQQIHEALNKMARMPVYFSETAKVNAFDIRAKAEKLQRQFGLDMLFIDYLQLIDGDSNKNKTRENEVSAISRAIKLLAMDLKIPVCVLAQLNRQAASGDWPELHHLRESGAIEQDADIVLFLHRDWAVGKQENENGDSTENEADLLVRKWRNGKSHIDIKIGFKPETMDFYEPEPNYFSVSNSLAIKNYYEVERKEDAPF